MPFDSNVFDKSKKEKVGAEYPCKIWHQFLELNASSIMKINPTFQSSSAFSTFKFTIILEKTFIFAFFLKKYPTPLREFQHSLPLSRFNVGKEGIFNVPSTCEKIVSLAFEWRKKHLKCNI